MENMIKIYSCKCSKLTGERYKGITCPDCQTPVLCFMKSREKLNLSSPYGAHNGNIIGDIKSYSQCNADIVSTSRPNEETDFKESITLEFINSLKELAKTVYGDDKLREL